MVVGLLFVVRPTLCVRQREKVKTGIAATTQTGTMIPSPTPPLRGPHTHTHTHQNRPKSRTILNLRLGGTQCTTQQQHPSPLTSPPPPTHHDFPPDEFVPDALPPVVISRKRFFLRFWHHRNSKALALETENAIFIGYLHARRCLICTTISGCIFFLNLPQYSGGVCHMFVDFMLSLSNPELNMRGSTMSKRRCASIKPKQSACLCT